MRRGITVNTCNGLRPRCEASATIPPMSMMPVMATKDRRKTFVNSQRIMRNRMVPNTPSSVPSRPLAVRFPIPRTHAPHHVHDGVHHQRNQVFRELGLAELAPHLDPQEVVAQL